MKTDRKIKLRIIAMVISIAALISTLTSCSFGSDGKDGADGLNGSDGKSAYEIAVENGFVGSEADWIASLQGSDGVNGSDGKDGADGTISDLTSTALNLLADSYQLAVKDGYSGNFAEYINDCFAGVSDSSTLAVNKGLLSSVIVYCKFSTVSSFPYGSSGSGSQQGSGVIYKLDKTNGTAYIITNHHVVYSSSSRSTDGISDEISVYLYGNVTTDGAIKAEYVGGSQTYDIAVLKITGSDVLKNSVAQAVTVADSNDIRVGDSAIAIGNAEGLGISATTGIISVDSEYIEMTSVTGYGKVEYRVMRIDTAVNSGNSGGGLFNSKGELIGIVNAKTSDTSVEGIGYAIPSNIAVGAAQNIIDNCDGKAYTCVRKCTVGVTLTTNSSTAVYDAESGRVSIKETIAVNAVDSSAVAAGKLEAGDIIKSIKIGDTTVSVDRMFHIIDAFLYIRAGDSVTIEFERGGENMSVDITFSESNITNYD